MKKFGALFGCTALLSVSVSTYAAPAYVDFVEPRARGNDSVVYNPDPMSAGASGLTTFNVSNMDVPGTFGVDMSVGISKTITEAKWSCMHTTGNYQFAIVEGWQGGYGQNTGLASAVKDAWNAGFKDVDVYAFMCPNCHNSAASATQLVNYLKRYTTQFSLRCQRGIEPWMLDMLERGVGMWCQSAIFRHDACRCCTYAYVVLLTGTERLLLLIKSRPLPMCDCVGLCGCTCDCTAITSVSG
eukprot:m.1216520 g.1216520  ORF g.1216520 m.1216520 type:complete len:242 (+) comp24614_c0_seq2:154-879(+)